MNYGYQPQMNYGYQQPQMNYGYQQPQMAPTAGGKGPAILNYLQPMQQPQQPQVTPEQQKISSGGTGTAIGATPQGDMPLQQIGSWVAPNGAPPATQSQAQTNTQPQAVTNALNVANKVTAPAANTQNNATVSSNSLQPSSDQNVSSTRKTPWSVKGDSDYAGHGSANYVADSNGRPGVKSLMDTAGIDFDTASHLIAGITGANEDTRDWNKIMSSSDPVSEIKKETAKLYSNPNQPVPAGYNAGEFGGEVVSETPRLKLVKQSDYNGIPIYGVAVTAANGVNLGQLSGNKEIDTDYLKTVGIDPSELKNLDFSKATTSSSDLTSQDSNTKSLSNLMSEGQKNVFEGMKNYNRGGRTGYADGGANPSALKNYIDMMSNNPSLMALAAQQQSGYSSLPGAHLPGPYGVQINPTQPRQLMTASAQLGPQQTAMGTINQAAQFGNSVSSLADGAEKLKNKLIAEPGSKKGWLDELMSSDTTPSAETYTSVTPPVRPEIFNKGGQVGR